MSGRMVEVVRGKGRWLSEDPNTGKTQASRQAADADCLEESGRNTKADWLTLWIL